MNESLKEQTEHKIQLQKIIVEVNSPQYKSESGGSSKHYYYPIVGSDRNGSFNVNRRFSQFEGLRQILISKWPGIYIPSLIYRNTLGTDDSIFIQIKKKGLKQFLDIIASTPYIWYSQEFQIIVRNGEDCQKTLSKLKQINLPNILAKYKQLFPEFLNKQVSKQINSKIVDFNQFLKQAVGLLQNLEKMTQQIFSARKKANDKYFNLIEVLMPDYEKNCFSFYKNSSNQQIFTASNVQEKQNYLAELSKNKQNDSIIYLFEEIRKEKFQIQAFEEAIKKKQMYLVLKNKAISKLKDLQIQLVKLNAGKQSFFSKITKKSKEDQLKQIETSIQKAQQQEQVLALICQVITSLLGYSEIQRFKKFRQKSYYELLQKFFSMELEESRRKRKFWTQIGQNSSIKIQVEKSTQNIQVYEQEKDNFFGDEASYEQNKTQQKEQLQKNQQINTQQRETQTEFHQNPLVALENQDQQEQNTQNQKGQQLLQEQVQENEQNMDD